MSNPSDTLLELEASLNAVIETLIDGQKGFRKIGEELKDPTLKLYFLEESLRRAEFRGDLETILHQEGVHDIHESGTMTATVLRTWAEIKETLGGGDNSLLESAEQDEHAALDVYKEALMTELPFPVRELLNSQAAHILRFHDYAKAVRQRAS